MPPLKDGRILRTTSKLNPPSTGLDKALYATVLFLWISVAATWTTARARQQQSSMREQLAESNGNSGSVMRGIDWWKTGRAQLQHFPGIVATPTRRMGHSTESVNVVGADSDGGSVASEGAEKGAKGAAAENNSEVEGLAGAKDMSVFQEIAIEVEEGSKGILRRILRGT